MAFISVQGFQIYKDKFIVKEFALKSTHFHSILLFNSPFHKSKLDSKSKRTVNWLSHNLHKIKWDDEGLKYSDALIEAMCAPFPVIYTKGSQPRVFLEQFHQDVRDLTNMDTPKIPTDYPCPIPCFLPQHDVFAHCAVRSACFYHDWLGHYTI